MKNTLFLLSFFFVLLISQLSAQIKDQNSTLKNTYINEEVIQMKITFRENGNDLTADLLYFPKLIHCTDTIHLNITVVNESSSINNIGREVRISKILGRTRRDSIENHEIFGGLGEPIIIHPPPPGRSSMNHTYGIYTYGFLNNTTFDNILILPINENNGFLTNNKELSGVFDAYNQKELTLENVQGNADAAGLQLNWDVKNNGCTIYTAFSTKIFASEDSIIDEKDTVLYSNEIIGLNKNELRSHNITIKGSPNQFTGINFIIFQVDTENSIKESNELDNIIVINNSNDSRNIVSNYKKDLIVYPQPFIDKVNFKFRTNKRALVSISVYNSSGILETTIVNNKDYSEGKHLITSSIGKLTSGIYFYVLQIGNEKRIGRLIKK